MKFGLLAAGVFACVVLPGCIVQDIHDQIEHSNQQLGSINDSFAKVEKANELLAALDERLESLESIEQNLALIDEKLAGVNTELDSMDERLATLQGSLDEVDGHLASLRRTINNIDSTIPFLTISGDDEAEAQALENPEVDSAVPVRKTAEVEGTSDE